MGRNGRAKYAVPMSDRKDKYRDDVFNRYKGADRTRYTRDMRGTIPSGSSADYHYQNESSFYFLQEIARDIDRNDPVAGQAMDRLVSNVIQGGFNYLPETGDDRWDNYLKQKWADHAEDAQSIDFQRESTFNELTELIFRQSLTDGDHLVLPLTDLSFQQIESHLCRTPVGQLGVDARLCVHGVQLDQNRQRISYYLAEDDVSMTQSTRHNNFRTVPAFDSAGNRNIFHVKNIKRASQTRGASIYAPIVYAISLLDDVQYAKLVQQQNVSSWAYGYERDVAGEFPDDPPIDPDYMTDVCELGGMKALEEVSAGMIFRGLPGETLKGFSPNVPNPTYLDHAKQIMELIGTNMGLPYIVLMMDASETNFSGWRGAMEQAKLLWMQFQRHLASQWHRQANQFTVRQWVDPRGEHFDELLFGAVESGVNIFRHHWGFPSWPYVNPVEEVTANVLEVSKAQNSPRRVQARNGRDFQQVIVGELLDDNYALIDRAMTLAEELQEQHPTQVVTWERLVAVSVPDNVNLNTSQVIDDGSEEDDAQPVVADQIA